MRGFGGFQAFYYLQTLLTGDNETGRNPARFYTRGPLACIVGLNLKIMKQTIGVLVFIILLSTKSILGQSGTKNVLWFIPSSVDKVNGLAIGPISSTLLDENQVINGVTFEIIGFGFFGWGGYGEDPHKIYFKNRKDSLKLDSLFAEYIVRDTVVNHYIHNGIVISGLGVITDEVNGVCLSLLSGWAKNVTGLSINGFSNVIENMDGVVIGFSNSSFEMNGIQIGVFNRAVQLNGIQFGLWNRNIHRALPIINWNFKKK